MPRYLKIILIIAGSIVGLIILLWAGILTYVHLNKNKLAGVITEQINDNIRGTVSINKIEPTIFKGFPDISFQLSDITVRDSFYHIHKTDLVNMSKAYVSIDIWDALKDDTYVNTITLTEGKVTLYTNKDSISNSNIFKKKEQKKDKSTPNNPINHIILKDVVVSIQHEVKNKDFVMAVRNCDIQTSHSDTGFIAHIDIETAFNSFSFNTKKGSYIKEKVLDTKLTVNFNYDKNLLHVPVQNLTLDDFTYKFGGDFDFSDSPSTFKLKILATDLPYKEALSILTPPVREKLKQVNLDKIDNVMIDLYGKMKYRDTPYVKANFAVKNRRLDIPQGAITNATFKGYYLNVVEEGKGHGDANSMIKLYGMTGNYYGIDFTLAESSVTDLKDPVLRTHVSSTFDVTHLNDIIGATSFKFNSGNASIDLNCKIGINPDNNVTPNVNGKISFSETGFSYIPRDLTFTKAKGDIVFDGADVFLKGLKLKSEQNKIDLSGNMKNLLNLYYDNPEGVVIECDIHSDIIDLSEYRSFIGKRVTENKDNNNPSSAKLSSFAKQLDQVMDKSIVKLSVLLDKVEYSRFTSNDINAKVTLKSDAVELKNVALRHAGGNINLNGGIYPKDDFSNFVIDADLNNIDVHKLFYAFNNFGQDAIVDSNVQGVLTAKIDAKGGIQNSGDIVKNSLNGKIKFNLNKGYLLDFEPLGTIGKIIFFNRDLSHIEVEPLEGTLNVQNSDILIEPILIRTSAFNIFAEGVYGIPKGTYIPIQVPLRKPNKKNKKYTEKDLKKGIVINLHATDNNTGDVKIKLGKGDKKSD